METEDGVETEMAQFRAATAAVASLYLEIETRIESIQRKVAKRPTNLFADAFPTQTPEMKAWCKARGLNGRVVSLQQILTALFARAVVVDLDARSLQLHKEDAQALGLPVQCNLFDILRKAPDWIGLP